MGKKFRSESTFTCEEDRTFIYIYMQMYILCMWRNKMNFVLLFHEYPIYSIYTSIHKYIHCILYMHICVNDQWMTSGLLISPLLHSTTKAEMISFKRYSCSEESVNPRLHAMYICLPDRISLMIKGQISIMINHFSILYD